MADKFAGYNDDDPIVSDVPVKSTASGLQDVTQGVEKAGQTAFDIADKMAQESSNTQMLEAHSQLQQLATTAKIQMAQNPANASAIAAASATTIQSAKTNTPLNRKDHGQFNYLADGITDQLNLEAGTKTAEVSREQAKYQMINSSTDTLQQVSNGLMSTDPAVIKSTDQLIDKYYKSLSEGVSTAALTGVEAARQHKLMTDLITATQMRVTALSSGEADAKSVNALHIAVNPAPSPFGNANLPTDQTSLQNSGLYGSYQASKSMRADMDAGNIPPMSAWNTRNVGNKEFSVLAPYRNGSIAAQGLINSNPNWDFVSNEVKKLNKKGYNLSPAETGYKNRLERWQDDIKNNGGFQRTVMATPLGANATIRYNNRVAAIENTNQIGDPDTIAKNKQQQKFGAINDYWSELRGIGVGSNIPSQYHSVVDPGLINTVKTAFSSMGDSNSAITVLKNLTPENRNDVANAMPDARTKMAVYQLGQLLDKGDQSFVADYMLSQKDGQNVSPKDKDLATVSAGSMSDNKIKVQLRATLSPLLNFIGKGNPNEVETDKVALVDAALRYVRSQGAIKNDPNLTNLSNYMNTFRDNVQGRAYNIMSSHNYSIDGNIIPVNSGQADALQGLAMQQMRTKMVSNGMNNAEVDDYVSKNSPYLMSYQDGTLRLVDKNGRMVPDRKGDRKLPAFEERYDTHLMDWAAREAKKRRQLPAQTNDNLVRQTSLIPLGDDIPKQTQDLPQRGL